MKEQLVSYKLAKLAKEKGFNWKCLYFYCMNSTCNHIDTPTEYSFKVNANFDSEDNFGYGKTWSAPTLAFLQQWLREEHNVKLAIIFRENMSSGIESWDWLIKGQEVVYRQYKTYELALEAGLIEGLKLIK